MAPVGTAIWCSCGGIGVPDTDSGEGRVILWCSGCLHWVATIYRAEG